MAMVLTQLIRRACLRFYPRVYPDQSPVPLQTAEPILIDLAGMTKGIDNVHLDVRLSPQFQSHAKKLIDALMDQETEGRRRGTVRTGPSPQQWNDFRSSYTRMIEAAIHRAKTKDGLALIRLAQIAAIKFLSDQVHTKIEQLRHHLKNTLASDGLISDEVCIEVNEWLSWLARNRAKLKYKLLKQLLATLLSAEEGVLGELRESLLGVRWSLPKEFLANPLLLADSPFDEEFLTKHYVFLEQGHPSDSRSTYSYSAVDRLIPDLFRTSTPRHKTESALAEVETRLAACEAELAKLTRTAERANKSQAAELTKRKQPTARRLAEIRTDHDRLRADYLKALYGWAEAPANVDLLFNDQLSTDRIKTAKSSGNAQAKAEWKAQRSFQRRLLAVVERHFRDTGLLKQVVAAYEMAPLCKEYSSVLSPKELHQFLTDRTVGQDLLERMAGKKVMGRRVSTGPLIHVAQRIGGMSCRQERTLLIKFLLDVLTFRRDLTSYRILQQAASAVEVRNDPDELRLSQANRTLYEFYGTGEAQASAQTVLNHVILKADIRGSTTIVAELRKRSLNPASHFSLNFFDPLNEVLKTHGASKVFIEGDAVILSMVEHEEALEHQFSVARMCGIGMQLLDLVQTQNVACRQNGLPELELGIGLVYSNEPPTYLFDGTHSIMISPAIGKADRLSSCSWMLRKERAQRKPSPTNVDIYEIPEGDPLRGEKGETHVRYNLNGIELDQDAFVKLQSELALQKTDLVLPGGESPTSFFLGRYPDLQGTMHRLVVRQGCIRLFDRRHPQFGVPTADVFDEVVVNSQLCAQVETVLKSGDTKVKSTVGAS